MFVVHTTHPNGVSEKIEKIQQYSQRLGEVPQGIEELGEGVWYLQSIEQLSFLQQLSQAYMNTGLEFHVKGLSLP